MLTMEITRLIEQCRKGDADALGELYKTYTQQMRVVCRRYFSDEQTVEDVLHDAFVIIFTSFDRLRDVRRTEAWMTAITRNVASKYKAHLDALPTISLDNTNEAELITTEHEIRDVRGVPLNEVVRMIDRLPEGYGQVFRLSVFEGMSHKEIADMLGIEPHSSSSQLARAKKMLRKMMRHYWVAMLLLLFIPLFFFLLRKRGNTVVKDEKPVITKKEESKGEHAPLPKESPKTQSKESENKHIPMRQMPVTVVDNAQPLIVQTQDSAKPDTLSNAIAQEQMPPQKEDEQRASLIISPKKQVGESVIMYHPDRHTTNVDADSTQSLIAQAVDSLRPDTISNMIVQEQTNPDTISADTTKIIHRVNVPHYDMTDLFPHKPVTGSNNDKKWSLELTYAGQFDEQNRYNQPFSYKPYIDPRIQHSPGEAPSYIVPSSIDNWTDYAIYLANNPDAVSEKTRSAIMRIALNNAGLPGEDKILRTSHHQMPVTWSLALKYKLTNRIGLESGLTYSRLNSDFEMGAEDQPGTGGNAHLGKNTISEKQAIHYLGIPVKGIYTMYGGKQWSLYGSFGLTTEIPVHSTIHSDYFIYGQHEASDKRAIHAPWQFSTNIGFGLQYHLTPNVGLFVEPSLQYYIPMKSDIETYRTEHPFTFSLPLGIRFTW